MINSGEVKAIARAVAKETGLTAQNSIPMQTAQLAEALGTTPANIRMMQRRGNIHGKKIGGRWWFDLNKVKQELT